MIRSRQVFAPKAKTRARKAQLARCWLVGGALFVLQTFGLETAQSVENYKPKHFKQYIFIELNDVEQSYCLIDLFHKESRFNPKAKNGSHYGIPQGRSTYLKNVNGIKQIQWSFKYIGNRYGYTTNGVIDACKAWQHSQIKGWY
jgi:hypothetical protein